MDPTYGPGYFALGELREALGDGQEAERVYELAMRLPSAMGEALARRGQLKFRRGDRTGASADLEASLSVEPDRLERLDLLGRWYLEARQWAPGLAVWRRVLALKERAGAPEAELQGLRTRVRALILLAGETDPVSSGARDQPGWIRGAFAQIAARLPDPAR